MQKTDFFTYASRRVLYVNLYRDVLKSAKLAYPQDHIVAQHIAIKARYLIRQVIHEHELIKIQENYTEVSQLRDKVKNAAATSDS